MIAVTDAAKEYLAVLIDQNEIPEDHAIRLVAGPEGVSLAPDTANEADTAFEHGERPVLIVENALGEQLGGMTLAVEETEEGPKLAITQQDAEG
jgi:Fe-S cluster assembly iron-binding protein IscA